jgi:hypothetical protein
MAVNASGVVRQEAFDNNYQTGCINVHYSFSHNGSIGGAGRMPRYNLSKPFTCNIIIENANSTTFAHEIGHTLGLSHTHDTRGNQLNINAHNCLQESVSRTRIQGSECSHEYTKKKCSVNGDALCDTEADPMLLGKVIKVSGQFEYNGGGTDNWDEEWIPNVNNIMSYSHRDSREFFSHLCKLPLC